MFSCWTKKHRLETQFSPVFLDNFLLFWKKKKAKPKPKHPLPKIISSFYKQNIYTPKLWFLISCFFKSVKQKIKPHFCLLKPSKEKKNKHNQLFTIAAHACCCLLLYRDEHTLLQDWMGDFQATQEVAGDLLFLQQKANCTPQKLLPDLFISNIICAPSETEVSDSGLLGLWLWNFVLPLWPCMGKRNIHWLSCVWSFRKYILSPPTDVLPYFMWKTVLSVVQLTPVPAMFWNPLSSCMGGGCTSCSSTSDFEQSGSLPWSGAPSKASSSLPRASQLPGVRTKILIIRCIQLNWLPSSDWMLTLIQQNMFYRHNFINENRNALISWGCLFTSSGLSLRNNWESITNAYFLVVCLHLLQSWNLDAGQMDFFTYIGHRSFFFILISCYISI